MLAATLFFVAFPINIGFVRLFLVTAILLLAIVGIALIWHIKKLRLLLLFLLMVSFVFLVAPGRSHDAERLRGRYVEALRSYEGTLYIWGGENRFGIDCSGLVRKGLIDANFRDALLTLNPGRMRAALELWWYDCSAKALKNNYRDWTRSLFTAPAVNDIAADKLAPGDIAITSNGVHALVHLGHGQWLEADPRIGKVFCGNVPVENSGWFEMPVHILRWNQLEEQ